MYKFKEAARRGSALFAAASLLAGIGASAMPVLVSADALNPLTERSLTLSSSSPGWSYLDGSGNSTYAPPNSGANGQKTGDMFSFRTTTATTTIKAFTFQYCTGAAGNCMSPGDDGFISGTPDTRAADSTSTSDFNAVSSSPSEINNTNWGVIQARQSGVTPGQYAQTPLADNSEGNFVVLVNGTVAAGWSMSVANKETGTVAADTATGKNNLIKLTNSTGTSITTNDHVQIYFFGTNTNYLTNPGSGAFFVRINDYSDATDRDPTTSTHIVDGGVTVANVMNQSISIQTKVLETMDFSVGTHDPDTYNVGTTNFTTNTGLSSHGQCDALLMKDPTLSPSAYTAAPDNVLQLGDATQEYSLKTSRPYTVDSYWRLSSNSSGGATVYYTGHTLTNTEGDEIAPLQDSTSDISGSGSGLGTQSHIGSEQFGLGIDQNSSAPGSDTYGTIGTTGDFADYVNTVNDTSKAHTPQLTPLVPTSNYGNAYGDTSGIPNTTTGFAFSKNADTYAIPIASENTQVVNCVTAKMRYMANIAATTPAGIYTTKINYVASPQY